MITIYHYLGGKLGVEAYDIPHDQIRKCLFDMNYNKGDIVFNTNSASICSECSAKLDRVNLPSGFKKKLEKDLKKLKKDLFYKMYDFVKLNPKVSLVLASFFAILLNLISSVLYNYIKNIIE